MPVLAEPLPAERVAPAVWAGFSIMCVGMFMAILDIQVVATSLPAIRSALGIRPDEMSVADAAGRKADRRSAELRGSTLRDRLLPKLRARHRALRLGLPDAGLP